MRSLFIRVMSRLHRYTGLRVYRVIEPRKSAGDQIDLWYGKLSRRHAWLKKSAWISLKTLKKVSGVQLTPQLALAIRKEACSAVLHRQKLTSRGRSGVLLLQLATAVVADHAVMDHRARLPGR